MTTSMQPHTSEFHICIERKLVSWVNDRQKLRANIKAGSHSNIISVNGRYGIVFDLGAFEGQFLNKYYKGDLYTPNAEKLIKEIALIVSNISSVTPMPTFSMNIDVQLLPNHCRKRVIFAKGKPYIAV